MAGVNKVILIGRLGKDPEYRVMDNGTPLCTFSLATSETWKDKDSGERKEATEWHSVQCWRGLAEVAAQYLKKGHQVYVEGSLRTRSWEKDGLTRYTTDIRVSSLTLIEKSGNGSAPPPPTEEPQDMNTEDDLPF